MLSFLTKDIWKPEVSDSGDFTSLVAEIATPNMEGLADLLGEDPRLAPDIYFRVIEEVPVNGILKKKTELVGAHKFVLAMLSDVFKTMFFGPMRNENEEIDITGTTIEAFKEFLKILYSLHTSSCKTSLNEVKSLFNILNLCRRYMVQPAVTLIEARILSTEFNTSEPESIINAAVIANDYKELEGFQNISKKLLQNCSISLNEGLTTVHKITQFFAQVETKFSGEVLSLVVRLLAFSDCSNCKAPKCLHGCEVTQENIFRAKDATVTVSNAVLRDQLDENEEEFVGKIDPTYYERAFCVPNVYIKWNDFLYGGDVFNLNRDYIYFKCKGVNASSPSSYEYTLQHLPGVKCSRWINH